MSVYGYDAELNYGNTANTGILALNRDIRRQNELNRAKYQTTIKGLKDTYNNTDTGLDKIKEKVEGAVDGTYALGGAIKAVYRGRTPAGTPQGTARATEAGGGDIPDLEVFEPPTPLPPPTRGGGVAGSTEALARGEGGIVRQPGLRSALRTTQTPEGDAVLRRAEALPDANAPEGVELGSIASEGDEVGAGTGLSRTVDAGRGAGLTGTNLDGLELPGTVPTPGRFSAPATADTAREAGRLAQLQGQGGDFDRLQLAQRSAQRARAGESLEDITGFAGRTLNPASRVSAGPGRQIAQSINDIQVRAGDGIGEGGRASEIIPNALPSVNRAGGRVSFGGTEVFTPNTDVAPNVSTADVPQTLTAMREADEAQRPQGEASRVAGDVDGEPLENVAQKGAGFLDKGGVVAKGLAGVSKGLTALNIAQGGYDAIKDIADKGIQGKNINEKIGNVSAIVSGGADAVGTAVASETGAGALAAGLETAGAMADATGVGAVLGLGLGALGAGVGAFGAVEDYIGGKKEKQADKQKLQQAQARGAVQQAPQALQTGGLSGQELRMTSQGIGAVS